MARRGITIGALAVLAALFAALAMLRPLDHDESQYVAAAVLSAHGLLPYRDYAFLQTPLQPLLFAPLAWLAGPWTWPALRLANALLGAAAVACVAGAARAGGASARQAVVAAALFATCDVFLFSIATARNDALPCALYAAALWLIVRGHKRPADLVAIGLLLTAAAAAKISYALPVATYAALMLGRARRLPWLAAGAAPVLLLVVWTFWQAPAGFVFGTLQFPAEAPQQYYLATGRPWKLTTLVKALDTLKFLALGPALLGIAAIAIRRPARPTLLDALILAGLLSALLPTPTWRQYFLPMLPPLFVRLAQIWSRRPPLRAERVAAVALACAGLAPSAAAIAAREGSIAGAMRQSRAVAVSLTAAGIRNGEVATLSPQFLPGAGLTPDPRFATGPFYFRSVGLLSADRERALHLVSGATLAAAPLPRVVLTGGEGAWTSGDNCVDRALEQEAIRRGYRPVPVERSGLRMWVRR